MSLRDLYELSDDAVPVPDVPVFDAVIATDATTLEPVFVTIPEFDTDLSFGPAAWTPVPRPAGLYYPKKGDAAVVVRPGPDSIWIIAWTPNATDPDVADG